MGMHIVWQVARFYIGQYTLEILRPCKTDFVLFFLTSFKDYFPQRKEDINKEFL